MTAVAEENHRVDAHHTFDGGTSLPSTETWVDGTVFSLATCDFDAGVCCSYNDYLDDADSCVAACSCEESEWATSWELTDENGTYIRGVPVLSQHDVTRTILGVDRTFLSGCGAVALAELFLWYDAQGFSALADPYRHGPDGIVDWQEMTEDYMDALDTRNFGANLNEDWDAGSVAVRKIASGIEEVAADAGYTVDVEEQKLKSGDEDDAFSDIANSIRKGRPIYLAFDSDNALDEGALGGGEFFDGMEDEFGSIDHFGLITGFDDTEEGQEIFVNMGWGDGSNEHFPWKI